MGIATHEYTLTGYGESVTTARVRLQVYSRQERARRALTGVATAWGLALAAVFIPVAHFVLVPIFLTGGIYLFLDRWRTAAVAAEARGICPDCGAEQALDLTGRWHLPRDVTCQSCRRALRLSQTPPPRA